MSTPTDPRWRRAEQIRMAFDAYRVHALALRQRREVADAPPPQSPVPSRGGSARTGQAVSLTGTGLRAEGVRGPITDGPERDRL